RALKPSVSDCWDRSVAAGWLSGDSPWSARRPRRGGWHFDQVEHAFIRLTQKLRITANGPTGIQDCWVTPIPQERMINEHRQAGRRHVGRHPIATVFKEDHGVLN